MSVHVWSWVLEHSPAGDRDVGSSATDRLVLLVLADHAHKDGSGTHPSIATIAHEARCKRRSVYYALDALEAAGCIVQTGTTSNGEREWMVLMTPEAASAKFAQRPTRKPRQKGAQSLHENRANDDKSRANGDGNGRASINRPEPSPGTGLEPPLAREPARTLARVGDAGEGAGRLAPLVITKGTAPRASARLRRTARRTGAPLDDERNP